MGKTTKRKCAFCPHPADSPEHIWSVWMRELFHSKRYRFRNLDKSGTMKIFHGSLIDHKAHVVCEQCNNTWMSQLEQYYFKPAMEKMITGSDKVHLDIKSIAAIVMFMFKTSVIANHMDRAKKP